MKKITWFLLMLFFSINLFTKVCRADEAMFNFDQKTYYDIYLYGESKTVIRHVKILKQIEISQKIFLVIEPSDFNIENNQGYVNIDTVSTILPSLKFSVDETKGFKLFHPSENK